MFLQGGMMGESFPDPVSVFNPVGARASEGPQRVPTPTPAPVSCPGWDLGSTAHRPNQEPRALWTLLASSPASPAEKEAGGHSVSRPVESCP